MRIVDSQIHLWEHARMSPPHRQVDSYSVDDALREMAQAWMDLGYSLATASML